MLNNVSSQHVTGYPNSGQIFYYLKLPLIVAAVAMTAIFLCNFVKRLPIMLAIAASGCLLYLPVYLLPYSGGV